MHRQVSLLMKKLAILSVLFLAQCKTAGAPGSRVRAEASPYLALASRLRSEMSPKDVQTFLGDLHRTSLSQEQLIEILALTFAPMHSHALIQPVIRALVERHADPNVLMSKNVTVGDREIAARGYQMKPESLTCGIIDSFASSASSKESDLFVYRSYLFPDDEEDSHVDPEYITKNILHCDQGTTEENSMHTETISGPTGAGEFCSSKIRFASPAPQCPKGWTVVHNRKAPDGEDRYQSGCEREHNTVMISEIPENDAEIVRRQCPGKFSNFSDYDSQVIFCETDGPLANLRCPNGYSRRSRQTGDTNEREEADSATKSEKEGYLHQCLRKVTSINPAEATGPFASHVAELRDALENEQERLHDVLAKMKDAGGNLDQPCRWSKNLRRDLADNEDTYGSMTEFIANREAIPLPLIAPPTAQGITNTQILVVKLLSQDWVITIFQI